MQPLEQKLVPTPFLSYGDALLKRYGCKTYKVTLSGGRSCPTRDGTYGPGLGWGGCSFCDVYGSASYFSQGRKNLSVREQMEAALPSLRDRFKAKKFIAYFQSYTTTHQELDEFRGRYDEAVAFADVVALAVGTRPDCMPSEVLQMLYSYMDRVDIQLEVGVQSFREDILQWFARGHGVDQARDAIARALRMGQEAEERARRPGALHVCLHVIFGSPQEVAEDMITAAQEVNASGAHGVKIHNLHVLEKTKLARLYAKEKFPLLEMEDYLERVALFLRHLRPDIVIHRTHGVASNPEELVAPEWSRMKVRPSEALRVMMAERGWAQGDLAF